MKKYIVYQHKRLDTNEIFYIGIGCKQNRPYSKFNRNLHWRNIVTKFGYSVEIVKEFLSKEDACKMEKELILLYGRKDLGQGTLVNFTNGGEGAFGRVVSLEERETKNKKLRGKKRTQETKNKMSISTTKRMTNPVEREKIRVALKGIKVPTSTITKRIEARNKVIIDTITGICYSGAKEAALNCNINLSTLKGYLSGKRKNITSLQYKEL